MKKVLVSALAALSTALVYAQSLPEQWTVDTVVSGLDYPWDIATDGSRIYMTEKAGYVLTVEGNDVVRASIETSAPIETDGGRGLLGMALAPDFSNSGLAYFYQSTAEDNRVIEAEQEGDSWRETRVVLEGIPGHPLYNGGRVAFGTDGMLYVTTGWTENESLPQDVSSLAGKVLRIMPDGSIPEDNPFPNSPVWSLGHRNPQGLAWNDEGQLFVAEHGQSGYDEINLIEPGANYGWPLYQGYDAGEGMRGALASSEEGTWAPSGIDVHNNTLIVAALVGQGVYSLPQGEGDLVSLVDFGERVRDVLSLDGAIYAITSNRSPRSSGPSEDSLIRLTPTQ